MAVSIAEITKLRKMTGAGMIDCKNALAEANGDLDAAVELIRKRGQAIAAKREDRDASEGCVLAAANGEYAAIVALKCETDFVATNQDFISLTQMVLDAAMTNRPADIEALKAIMVDGRTIAELIIDRSGITGEKMELGDFMSLTATSTMSYIHPGNRLATIVGFNKGGVEYQVARDVAMQVAAMNPIAVSRDEFPADLVAKEFEIAKDKAREEGKPDAMLEKIAQGRINKFYQENSLLEQAFVKESKMTIKQYLESKEKALTVISFKRFTLNAD
ncbi:MAG: translation elongation factor Ts [Bacteroidales bacterium]